MIPVEQYLFFAVSLYAFFHLSITIVIAFFYSLFWLRKWGAFKLPDDNLSKKMTLKNQSAEQSYILENIFLTKS